MSPSPSIWNQPWFIALTMLVAVLTGAAMAYLGVLLDLTLAAIVATSVLPAFAVASWVSLRAFYQLLKESGLLELDLKS